MVPTLFNIAYTVLFNSGVYLEYWREGISIILLKANKPNYSVLKAYRVISLLNCLRKALEKIYATRLGYLANSGLGLLHYTQLGGRKQRLVIDTALYYSQPQVYTQTRCNRVEDHR